MKILAKLAMFAGALAVSSAAQASVDDHLVDVSEDGTWLLMQDANRCKMVLHVYDGHIQDNTTDYDVRWQGACRNGWMEGQGTLTIDLKVSYDPRILYRYTIEGAIVEGRFQGRATLREFDTYSGTMAMADTGDSRNPMPSDYLQGCGRYVSPEGVTDPEIDPTRCNLANGTAFYRAQLAASAAAPAPAAPAPAQFSSGGGASGGGAGGGLTGQLVPARNALSDALDNAPRGNGQGTIDTIIGALQASLNTPELAGLLGNDQAAISSILEEVRYAISSDGAALLNGSKREILDTLVGMVEGVISQRREAPAPAPALAASPGSAAGSARFSMTPENMAAAFQRLNQPLTPSRPAAGGGYQFAHAQNRFDFYTNQCEGGNGCRTLELRACYAMPDVPLTQINQWNNEKLFGRAVMSARGRLCIDWAHRVTDQMTDDRELASVVAHFIEIKGEAERYFQVP